MGGSPARERKKAKKINKDIETWMRKDKKRLVNMIFFGKPASGSTQFVEALLADAGVPSQLDKTLWPAFRMVYLSGIDPKDKASSLAVIPPEILRSVISFLLQLKTERMFEYQLALSPGSTTSSYEWNLIVPPYDLKLLSILTGDWNLNFSMIILFFPLSEVKDDSILRESTKASQEVIAHSLYLAKNNSFLIFVFCHSSHEEPLPRDELSDITKTLTHPFTYVLHTYAFMGPPIP